MTWVHLKPNAGMGLTEQWILRYRNAPVISLKRDREAGPDCWQASILHPTGISTVVLHVRTATLAQAQADSEQEMWRMGWQQSDAPTQSAWDVPQQRGVSRRERSMGQTD